MLITVCANGYIGEPAAHRVVLPSFRSRPGGQGGVPVGGGPEASAAGRPPAPRARQPAVGRRRHALGRQAQEEAAVPVLEAALPGLLLVILIAEPTRRPARRHCHSSPSRRRRLARLHT